MTVEWDVHAYKARLDAAIAGDRWEEADRVRVAAKHRLIEVIAHRDAEQVGAARDAFADSFERARLTKKLRINKGPLTMVTMLLADGETAGIAMDSMPASIGLGRDVRETILAHLGSGNKRPMTTTELSKRTGHRPETIARTVSQLRAEKRIVSKRIGRNVLHRLFEPDLSMNILGNALKKRTAHLSQIKDKQSAPDLSKSDAIKNSFDEKLDHGTARNIIEDSDSYESKIAAPRAKNIEFYNNRADA